jgi:hypothetical protein
MNIKTIFGNSDADFYTKNGIILKFNEVKL